MSLTHEAVTQVQLDTRDHRIKVNEAVWQGERFTGDACPGRQDE
jgi:hypothetical protein